MAHLLTEGAIMKLLTLGDECSEPTVQVLGHESFKDNDSRIRLHISDGKHSITFAMLAPQLCSMVTNGDLEMFSIIRISDQLSYIVSGKDEGTHRRAVIILELEILRKGSEIGHVIGTPIAVNDMGAPQIPGSAPIDCVASIIEP